MQCALIIRTCYAFLKLAINGNSWQKCNGVHIRHEAVRVTADSKNQHAWAI